MKRLITITFMLLSMCRLTAQEQNLQSGTAVFKGPDGDRQEVFFSNNQTYFFEIYFHGDDRLSAQVISYFSRLPDVSLCKMAQKTGDFQGVQLVLVKRVNKEWFYNHLQAAGVKAVKVNNVVTPFKK
jgi:hypothetical protein